MTSPCLGPELSLDAGGRIQLDLCGPPLQQDWPFDCSASQNNGLHRDADGCLWVTPQTSGAAGLIAGALSCSLFCGISTTAAAYNTAVASLSITNIDPCRARSYYVYTDYMWRFTPTVASTVTNMYRQVTGVDGADAGWTLVHTLDSGNTNYQRLHTGDAWAVTNLAPGASRTIKVGMRINMGTGTATANTFDARVAAIGIASD